MKLKGIVDNVIFFNSENGYTVLELITEKSSEGIVCTGILPAVSKGEELELTGEFITHARFGEQFNVKECKVTSPESLAGIERYLSSGLIKGVGPTTAKAIVRTFKKEALEIIEKQPELLATVKGISQKKAQEISESYNAIKDMRQTVMFLQGFDMTLNLAVKIYNVYREKTADIVKMNPYALIDDIDGVGFLTADKIARSMGHQPDSEFRVRAGVIFTLRENSERSGNTYMYESDLKEKVFALLKLTEEEILATYVNVMEILEFELTVKRLTMNGQDCVSLAFYYNTERSIAARLVRLHNVSEVIHDDEELIANFENINGIKLHALQKEAVKRAVNSGVSVITGGPGTGKTTIIKCVCYIFRARGMTPLCVTPTGRAAKRMQQATGEDAKTIHRALEFQYKSGMFFGRNENNCLNNGVIIVDEMSMVDIFVFNALLKAIKEGSRLVLVGDKDQLPSVGAGNVLADIIASGLIEISYLKHIYRQSEDSLIISNAHLINECQMPVINNHSKDFFYISRERPDEIAQTVKELIATRLPKFHSLAPTEIQVLSPMKAGAAGVESINSILQETLNPPSPDKRELRYGNTIFRAGDKVMQTMNDYQAEWVRQDESGVLEMGEGVFNGDIGFISEVEMENELSVTFDDGRTVRYAKGDLANLTLAYCITIHKSQGSEFDVAVIPLISGPPTILNKNLLYTGVTRAKKSVVLVGNRKHLYAMVKNNYVVQRNTLLKDFIHSEQERYKTFFA